MKRKAGKGNRSRNVLTTKPPKISLCMIVKNEEHCLRRCLDSVRDYVDEMIIVDTGSTDHTVEIAKSYHAQLYHHPWENDFSKHRNQSLAYATGDWILQLDADEELFPDDGSRLKDIVRQGGADCYHCRFYDIKKDGTIHGIFYLVRLFRNGLGMGYERKVHNQLVTQGTVAYSPIRIRHYGYDLTAEQMEAKHLRTTTLLQEALANDPEDAYSIYQLSSSFSMHREFDKAVAYGEMALDFMRRKQLKNSYFLIVFHTVARAYYAQGRTDDAERICLEALDFYPMHLDMCELLCDIYFRRQTLDPYRKMAERYLRIHQEIEKNPSILGGYFCHSFTRRHEIYFGLACIHFMENELENADAFFIKSFEDSGKQIKLAENICRFYLEQSIDEKALQWLNIACETAMRLGDKAIVGGVGRAAYDVAEMFFRRRQWRLAQPVLQLAIQIMPEGFDHSRFDRLLSEAE
jgi:glycosyltransferase involved in cell wall biosynthesis